MKTLLTVVTIASLVCGSTFAQDYTTRKHAADVAVSAQVCSVYFELMSEIVVSTDYELSVRDKQASLLATAVSSSIYRTISFPLESQISVRKLMIDTMRYELVHGGNSVFKKMIEDNDKPCKDMISNPQKFIDYANNPTH